MARVEAHDITALPRAARLALEAALICIDDGETAIALVLVEAALAVAPDAEVLTSMASRLRSIDARLHRRMQGSA
jgi:hypothetical protein